MCGIAGVLAGPGARPALPEEIRRMVAIIRHRGPDAWGHVRRGPATLGHARLSIVGLSDGHQPLANEDQTVWVTFNGEIFNHVELRRELEALGHRFRTSSDTEILVHAYEQWGAEAWPRLNGQYAFALWDCRQHLLWLVRDPLGILPLHWARGDGAVVFASEAKAIFAGGRVAASFDPAGIAQVFTRWAATAPATVFSGVHAVPPGTALVFRHDLSVTAHTHWQPRIRPECDLDGADAAEALAEALDRSIRLRLRADVPVGAYISGGLDSSVIAAMASRAHPLPLDSFSVRFKDGRFDETPQQRLMAELARTNHHEIVCDDDSIANALSDAVWHCETPLLRTGPLPLFLLSGLVRASGRKVVLTGEGADELLAGYDIFKEAEIRRFWARQPQSTARPRLLDRLYPDVASAGGAVWQRFFGSDLQTVDHPFHSHLIRWRNTAWSARFLAPHLRDALAPDEMLAGLDAALPGDWQQATPLGRAQHIEMASFLSSYLLACQGDRVAMAHGIEVRYPFLDPEVVSLCLSLPDRAKRVGLRDKLALRRHARALLPPDIADRPKKPYRAPMTTPFFAVPRPWIDGIADDLRRHDLADAGPTALLLDKARLRKGRMTGEREEMAVIGLLSLGLLARHMFDGFHDRAAQAAHSLASVPPTVADLSE